MNPAGDASGLFASTAITFRPGRRNEPISLRVRGLQPSKIPKGLPFTMTPARLSTARISSALVGTLSAGSSKVRRSQTFSWGASLVWISPGSLCQIHLNAPLPAKALKSDGTSAKAEADRTNPVSQTDKNLELFTLEN